MSPVAQALQELRAAPIADQGRPTLLVVDLVEQPAPADRIRFEVHYRIVGAPQLWAWPIEILAEDLPPAGQDVTVADYIVGDVLWRLREQRDAPLGKARLVRVS